MSKPQFYTNTLKKMAEEIIDSEVPVNESKQKDIDITEIYQKEVYYGMIINRESINMNINAPVREGKSTVALAEGHRIQKAIRSLIKESKKWSIGNIARSSYELMKKTQDPDLNNCIIVVDEFDDMDNTQMNSTVESSYLKSFSKIQAARYIHRIYCSPSDMPDSQSNILLTIDQADKKRGITKCYLNYKFQRGEQTYCPLLGHILVDVKPIIKNWIEKKVEEKFYSPERKKFKGEIAHLRKEDWYIDYQCRKFIKIDALSEKGLFNTRDLDYADIYLECIEGLKPLTQIRGAVSQKIVKSRLKILFRKYKIPTSILGEQLMSEKVDGILELYKIFYEQRGKMKQLENKKSSGKIALEDYEEEHGLLKTLQKTLISEANIQEDDLRELSQLKHWFYD